MWTIFGYISSINFFIKNFTKLSLSKSLQNVTKLKSFSYKKWKFSLRLNFYRTFFEKEGPGWLVLIVLERDFEKIINGSRVEERVLETDFKYKFGKADIQKDRLRRLLTLFSNGTPCFKLLIIK